MRFSIIPFKPQIGRFLKSILPKDLVIRIPQGKLKGTRWILGSGNLEQALGSYEYNERKLFEETVNDGHVIYDVGAHVGFYTLLASRLVGAKGMVVAFEPYTRNLKFLKRHIEINHCINTRVFDIAVSDRTGTAHFAEGNNISSGHIADNGGSLVNTTTLDELVESQEIPPPDCIKIDVEGAEFLVLKGAEGILRERAPTIILATHGPALHQNCIELLHKYSYQVRYIAGNPSAIFAFR